MKAPNRIISTALAAALAVGALSTPSFAQRAPLPVPASGGSNTGPYIVGCVFGSAFGLIAAAWLKGRILSDSKVELTQNEAGAIAFTCGLAVFAIVANFRRR